MLQTTEEKFHRELNWCIEQLEIGLAFQKPDKKQGVSVVAHLNLFLFVCFKLRYYHTNNQYPEKRKIKFEARLTTTDKTELLTTRQQCDSYI